MQWTHACRKPLFVQAIAWFLMQFGINMSISFLKDSKIAWAHEIYELQYLFWITQENICDEL